VQALQFAVLHFQGDVGCVYRIGLLLCYIDVSCVCIVWWLLLLVVYVTKEPMILGTSPDLQVQPSLKAEGPGRLRFHHANMLQVSDKVTCSVRNYCDILGILPVWLCSIRV
jgi:hypothetical protein